MKSLSEFEPIFVVGLMSGTSCDGVDAALTKTDGESINECLHAITLPYHRTLREKLVNVAQHDVPLAEVLEIERQLSMVHVEACEVLFQSDALQHIRPQIVGFHGHTIRHDPSRRLTWQLGDANMLAEKMGCPVVSDFRRRDIAAGGEGAPLAPLYHRKLLRGEDKPTAALNIGGVANITWLGEADAILAGDTGPGCGLMDAFIFEHTGKPYDTGGALAKSGVVSESMLERWMSDEFFQRPLPKSADRFQFRTEGIEELSIADGAATLTAFTVATVDRAIELLPQPPKTMFISGGGAHNQHLYLSISERLRDRWNCEVNHAKSVDSLEAECFAWLAVRRLRGLPTSLPETTGCDRPVCGGVLTHG